MNNSSYFISVILVAGGVGSRMKSAVPKQFALLKGKPVVLHSLELFSRCSAINEIIVVCDPSYRALFPNSLTFAMPGVQRQDSVWNGLQKVSPKSDLICIHDSARPFLTKSDLEKVLSEAIKHQAAALAVPVKYTIKEADEKGFVVKTVDRSRLWEMQTPQVATPALLKEGFRIAQKNNLTVTDDAALVELTGHPVKLVSGSYQNFKITTPEDWAVAENIAECISIS